MAQQGTATALATESKDTAPVVHSNIEQLAYALWEMRGRPAGSPEQDWYKAEEQARTQQSR